PRPAGRPLPPTVSRSYDSEGNPGSAARADAAVANGAFAGVSLTVIAGSCAYGAVFGGWIENAPVALASHWRARAKFGPGDPSAFRMPCDTRFATVWPFFGSNVPNTWSKL